MSDAFKPLLARLADGATLSEADAGAFFAACLKGEPTPAQVAAALTAMRMRGETLGEIAACAREMRAAAVMLEHPYDVIDVCGTGGDGQHTLNISTAVAFVVAGAGVKVAKHGNRALSSKSGTADILSSLGVNLQARREQQLRSLDEANICFLFAQAHHGSMKHVSPIRAELGFRTLFNLLGPLTNPAGAKRQLMGVFDSRWVEPLARVLGALGAQRAWVVHGGGLDELTTTGPSQVAEWRDGQVRLFTVTPEAVGLPVATLADLKGGAPDENAQALRILLDGGKGPYRDIVLLNAAAALLVADKVETLADGIALGGAVIGDGRAKAALAAPGPGDQRLSDILARIAAYKREDVRARKAVRSQSAVEAAAAQADPVRGFRRALEAAHRPGRLALIAEIKKASPSKGLIRADFDPPALARAYHAGGAACLSVLTDGPSFQGDDAYLAAARAAAPLPAIRKDFLVDPWQVAESRALGADAILVILAMIDDSLASDLMSEASRLGMDALVEVHDETEMDRAGALGATLVGVNNRNLKTFTVDLGITEALAPRAPLSALLVTESGIFTTSDAARLEQVGARAMLVGESLMRQDDVEAATRALIG